MISTDYPIPENNPAAFYIERFTEFRRGINKIQEEISEQKFDLVIATIQDLIERNIPTETMLPSLIILKGCCHEQLGEYELALDAFEKLKKIVEIHREAIERTGAQEMAEEILGLTELHSAFILLSIGRNEEAADLLKKHSPQTMNYVWPLVYRIVEKKLNIQLFQPDFSPISDDTDSESFLPDWLKLALQDRTEESLAILSRMRANRYPEYYEKDELDFYRAAVLAISGNHQSLKQLNLQMDIDSEEDLMSPMPIVMKYLTQ